MSSAYGTPGHGYHGGGGFGSAGYGYSGSGGMMDPYSIASNWGSSGLARSYANSVSNDENTAKVGASGALGLAAMTGAKIAGLSGIGGSVASAVGLGSLGVVATPLLGAAVIAGAGAVAALGVAKGTPALARGLGKIGSAMLNAFTKASDAAIEKSSQFTKGAKTKSAELDKEAEKFNAKEETFSTMVKKVENKMDKNEDIKTELKEMHSLKVPSARSQKELSTLSADYFISKGVSQESSGNRTVRTFSYESSLKELNSFAKEAGLSDNQKTGLMASLKSRVEEKVENLEFSKNGKTIISAELRGENALNTSTPNQPTAPNPNSASAEIIKKANEAVKNGDPKAVDALNSSELGRGMLLGDVNRAKDGLQIQGVDKNDSRFTALSGLEETIKNNKDVSAESLTKAGMDSTRYESKTIEENGAKKEFVDFEKTGDKSKELMKGNMSPAKEVPDMRTLVKEHKGKEIKDMSDREFGQSVLLSEVNSQKEILAKKETLTKSEEDANSAQLIKLNTLAGDISANKDIGVKNLVDAGIDSKKFPTIEVESPKGLSSYKAVDYEKIGEDRKKDAIHASEGKVMPPEKPTVPKVKDSVEKAKGLAKDKIKAENEAVKTPAKPKAQENKTPAKSNTQVKTKDNGREGK